MYKRNNQGWLKHIDFILCDVLALQLAFILAYAIRQDGFPYASSIYRSLGLMLVVVDILIAAVFNTMHNVMKRGYYQESIQTLKQVALVFVVIIIYLFSTQTGDTYSRLIVYFTMILHYFIGYFLRQAWKPIVRRMGQNAKKSAMILVADEKQIPDILRCLSPNDSVEYSGVILSNRDGTGEIICGIPVIASLETAADFICREWVDEVFVYPEHMKDIEVHRSELYKSVEGFIENDFSEFSRTDYTRKEYIEKNSWGSEYARESYGGDSAATATAVEERATVEEQKEASVAALIEDCRQMAIPIHIRLPLSSIGGKTFIEKVGGYTVLTSAVNYASPLQLAMKRTLDILGGLVGSLIALVVIAVVGPMIKKESPGPILFRQTRIGKNGHRFQMLKIRTMYVDADERKAELMKDNRVSDGMMFKLDWDPRIIGNKIVDGKQVTGIGEKLRAGSWDEWPQFFNILLSQMSLVGTRPPTVDEWEKYKYHHRARLATKPGLTGMWQVSGRSKITDFEEVVKLDTEYINHWSIGLDIQILLKTVKAVFTKDGAM